MNAPKLSVLMTVYNSEQYVAQTVESVLSQTFADFEFLVTDDASTDGTYSILADFAARDTRMILSRNESNKNITRSMNRLFALAQGRYITRHDGDDISMPERFARQVAFLDSHPEIGLVASQVRVIDQVGLLTELEMFGGSEDNSSIQRELIQQNCLCQGSVMFRRECLMAVGFYDEEVDHSEDYDLWLRMAEITQLAKLSDRLYYYRKHSQSISQTHYGATLSRGAVALDKAYQRRIKSGVNLPDPLKIGYEYACAIESCEAAGAMERVKESILGALKFHPHFLLAGKIRIPVRPTEEGLQTTETIFACLPQTAATARLKAHFLGLIYMREVFEGFATLNWAHIDRHLWTGLWYEPKWLLNRGVVVIILRTLYWKATGSKYSKKVDNQLDGAREES